MSTDTPSQVETKLAIATGKPLIVPTNSPATLTEALHRAAFDAPERGIYFIGDNGSETWITFPEILMSAKSVLAGLQQQGIKPGDTVILQQADKHKFLQVFWGCLLGGIVPVPLSPALSVDPTHKTFPKFLKIWTLLSRPLMVLDRIPPKLQTALDDAQSKEAKILQDAGVVGLNIHQLENLRIDPFQAALYDTKPDQLAFLQFTSGSTGNPKGVMLTHANLIANLNMLLEAGKFAPGYSVMNWMPFYHDMGLIGCHLAPLLGTYTSIQMAPFTFIKRPYMWLEKMDKFRATVTASPNFGYQRVLEKVTDEQLAKLDLSCLQVVSNGAEPISIPIMKTFMERLGRFCGLKPEAMFPVYGMAEACLAVTTDVHGSPPQYSAVHRKTVVQSNQIKIVSEDHPDALLFADEGYPVNGMQVRIADDQDQTLPEGVVGNVQMSGPNVTAGYYLNAEATSLLRYGAWARTGDLGFMLNGRLLIAGRSKDIIFINGQNFYAHDLEQIGAKVDGVDQVGAVGYQDTESGLEKVVIFVNLVTGYAKKAELTTQQAGRQVLTRLLQDINETFNFSPNSFVIIPSSAFPRTTSGKIQRYKFLEQFLDGQFADKIISAESLLGGETEAASAPHQQEQVGPQQMPSREILSKLIHAWWSEVLKLPTDRIGYDDSFFELGGTSIRAVEVIGMAEEHLACSLPQHMFATCKTINTLVDFMLDNDAALFKEARLERSEGDLIGQTRFVAATKPGEKDIAIIGLSCRFPGANNPTEFWDVLSKSKDCITEIPADRWSISDYYDPEAKGNKSTSKWGGFLDNIRDFDSEFFKISEAEARHMDPQQRIFLEVAWEALESTGYAKIDNTNIGVFASAGFNGYIEHFLDMDDGFDLHESVITGNLTNMVAARVAHSFNFKGPALTVDSACSSALLSVHLACQSILLGETEMAIAGGVQINFNVTPYLFFSKAGALSPDGRCKAFSEDANGIVPGEGAAAILLKSYQQALADGDPILAVIKGSAVNNDGHSLGVMAPNPDGQVSVMQQAYKKTGVSPATISYVEAHGTGTQIGDLIEVKSLSEVFQAGGASKQQCAIGSVKTNIGHLFAASGIAGLIKTVLALKHKQIPPNLHCKDLRKRIQFEKSPFYVNRELIPWSANANHLRRAAISSFGFGGTNCHMIIEEASAPTEEEFADANQPYSIMTFSAHQRNAFADELQNLRGHLNTNPNVRLLDLCYTKNAVKSHYWQHRGAFITNSLALAKLQLSEFNIEQSAAQLNKNKCYYQAHKSRPRGKSTEVVFLMSGQGSQFPEMGKQLFEHNRIFHKAVLQCQSLVGDNLSYSLVDLLTQPMEQTILNQTEITQPLLFTMDYALAKCWIDWGIQPAALMGHSIGEYAAACIAGVMSLEDAMFMVVERGKLMQQLPPTGGMGAIFASQEQVQEALNATGVALDYAAINAPNNIVVSGELAELEIFFAYLQSLEIGYARLRVSHAFHSRLMDTILTEFSEKISHISFQAPLIPLISNLDGQPLTHAPNAEYWSRHIRQPVLFEAGLRTLFYQKYQHFLEIGAKNQLTMLSRKMAPKDIWIDSTLPDQRLGKAHREHMLAVVAQLYVCGMDLNWKNFYACDVNTPQQASAATAQFTPPNQSSIEGQSSGCGAGAYAKIVEMPGYAFQRKESWLASSAKNPKHAVRIGDTKSQKLLKQSGMGQYSIAGQSDSPFFTEHIVQGNAIIPGMGQCDLLLQSYHHAHGIYANHLQKLIFQRPWLAEQSVLINLDQSKSAFSILEKSAASNQVLTTGLVQTTELAPLQPLDITVIYQRCRQPFTPERIYRMFTMAGLSYGSYFRNIITLHANANEAIAQLTQPNSGREQPLFHAGIVDSALQALIGCILANQAEQASVFIPMSIESMMLYRPLSPAKCLAYVKLQPSKSRELLKADVSLCGLDGNVCIAISAFAARRIQLQSQSSRPAGIPASAQNVRHFFASTWLTTPLAPAPIMATGTWLVLMGENVALAEILVERMKFEGHRIIEIHASDLEYTRVGKDYFVLNMLKETDHIKLFAALVAEGTQLAGIIDTCQVEATSLNNLAESTELTQPLETYFYLFKALSNSPFRKKRFVRVATCNYRDQLQTLPSSNPLITGFLRSMSQEFAELNIHNIEFIRAGQNDAEIVSAILKELQSNLPYVEVRYQDMQRKVFRIIPLEATDLELHTTPYQSDKVYWIVGGGGGVGAEVARHLARCVAPRIIISGRNERSDNPGHQLNRLIQELEALGSEIIYLDGDVSDPVSMTMLLEAVHAKWGSIHGIFQCALSLEDAFIQKKTWDSFTRVLAPRVQGTLLLDQLTRDEPLDFFMLFSSLTGIIGNIGQSDYTASNVFMEFFATQRQGPGLTRVIHWGQWQTGAVVSPAVDAILKRHKLKAIRAIDGMKAIDTMLAQDTCTHLIFAPSELDAKNTALTLNLLRKSQETLDANAALTPNDRTINLPVAPKQDALMHLLQVNAARVLEQSIDDMDIDMHFLEIGADSMQALSLVKALETALEIELYPTLLFEYPTIRELGDYLKTITPEDKLALLAEQALLSTAIPASESEPEPEPAPSPVAPALVTEVAVPAAISLVPEVPASPVVAAYTSEPAPASELAPAPATTSAHDLNNIASELITIAAQVLETEPDQIDPDMHFLEMGADSMQALKIVSSLEKMLDIELYPTLLFEYSNIHELADYLAELVADVHVSAQTTTETPVQIPAESVVAEVPIATQQLLTKPLPIQAATQSPAIQMQPQPELSNVAQTGAVQTNINQIKPMPRVAADSEMAHQENDFFVQLLQQQQAMMAQFFQQLQTTQQSFFENQMGLFDKLADRFEYKAPNQQPTVANVAPVPVAPASAPAHAITATAPLDDADTSSATVEISNLDVDIPPVATHAEQNNITMQELLIQLAAENMEKQVVDIDPDMHFLEMGADSMQALNIVKAIEQELALELYPTLLFEYTTINELADYLLELKPEFAAKSDLDSAPATAVKTIDAMACQLLPEAELTPVQQQQVERLIAQYGQDDPLAINRRHQAPLIFFRSDLQGFFYANAQGKSLLVLVYVGPVDYLSELLHMLDQHAQHNGWHNNLILDERWCQAMQEFGYSTTPIGVWQRLSDIQQFTTPLCQDSCPMT